MGLSLGLFWSLIFDGLLVKQVGTFGDVEVLVSVVALQILKTNALLRS